jgi:hypothetical protein
VTSVNATSPRSIGPPRRAAATGATVAISRGFDRFLLATDGFLDALKIGRKLCYP